MQQKRTDEQDAPPVGKNEGEGLVDAQEKSEHRRARDRINKDQVKQKVQNELKKEELVDLLVLISWQRIVVINKIIYC